MKIEPMKHSKKKFYKQDFWRENMMKILEIFYEHDLHWNRDLWENYGITKYSAKIIEKEFEKYLNNK